MLQYCLGGLLMCGARAYAHVTEHWKRGRLLRTDKARSGKRGLPAKGRPSIVLTAAATLGRSCSASRSLARPKYDESRRAVTPPRHGFSFELAALPVSSPSSEPPGLTRAQEGARCLHEPGARRETDGGRFQFRCGFPAWMLVACARVLAALALSSSKLVSALSQLGTSTASTPRRTRAATDPRARRPPSHWPPVSRSRGTRSRTMAKRCAGVRAARTACIPLECQGKDARPRARQAESRVQRSSAPHMGFEGFRSSIATLGRGGTQRMGGRAAGSGQRRGAKGRVRLAESRRRLCTMDLGERELSSVSRAVHAAAVGSERTGRASVQRYSQALAGRGDLPSPPCTEQKDELRECPGRSCSARRSGPVTASCPLVRRCNRPRRTDFGHAWEGTRRTSEPKPGDAGAAQCRTRTRTRANSKRKGVLRSFHIERDGALNYWVCSSKPRQACVPCRACAAGTVPKVGTCSLPPPCLATGAETCMAR